MGLASLPFPNRSVLLVESAELINISFRFLMKMSQLQNPTVGPCYIKYNGWILPSFLLGWCFSLYLGKTD